MQRKGRKKKKDKGKREIKKRSVVRTREKYR